MTDMTEEDIRREEARAAARAEELKGYSDAALSELSGIVAKELRAINVEIASRLHIEVRKVITLPCSARELESALVTHINHGLAEGIVSALPDADGNLAVFIRPLKEEK